MEPRDDPVRFPFGESIDGDSYDDSDASYVESRDEQPTDSGPVEESRHERPTDTGPLGQSSSEIRSPLLDRVPLDSAEGEVDYLDSGEEPVFEGDSDDPWSDMPKQPLKTGGEAPISFYDSMDDFVPNDLIESQDSWSPKPPDPFTSRALARQPGPSRPRPAPARGRPASPPRRAGPPAGPPPRAAVGARPPARAPGAPGRPPTGRHDRPAPARASGRLAQPPAVANQPSGRTAAPPAGASPSGRQPAPSGRVAPRPSGRMQSPAGSAGRPAPPPHPSGRAARGMGMTCPRCRKIVPRGPMAVACPSCQTRYHAPCAKALGGCSTPGCPQSVQARASRANLQAAPTRPRPQAPPHAPPQAPPQAPPPPGRSVVQRFSRLPPSVHASAEFNARVLQRNLEKISGLGEISGGGRVDGSDLGDTQSDAGSFSDLDSAVATKEIEVVGRRTLPIDEPEPSLSMFESDSGEATPVVEIASGLGMLVDSGDGEDSFSGAAPYSDMGSELGSDQAFASSGGAPVIAGSDLMPASASQRDVVLEQRLEHWIQKAIGLWTGDALWISLGLAALVVGPVLIYMGADFYLVTDGGGFPQIRPSENRPGQPLEKLLRPGGTRGIWFGIVGSALFVLNLTYILRRRFGLLKKLIGLRTWLNFHAICGLLGASLILAHTSLLFNNIPAVISFTGIVVAVVSGLFGRYVLLHLPRFADDRANDVAARQRELDERQNAAERLGELRRQLRIALADHPHLRDAAVEALASNKTEAPRGLRYLGKLLVGDVFSMLRNRKLAKELKQLLNQTKGKEARQALLDTLALVRNQSQLERRLAEAPAVRDLMDTWRGLHFILALVAVMFMFLHIALALPFARLSETFGG